MTTSDETTAPGTRSLVMQQDVQHQAGGQAPGRGEDREQEWGEDRPREPHADAGQYGETPAVSYRTVDSPVGTLLLATTERGLVRVAYEREDFDHVLEALARGLEARVLRAPQRLDAAAIELAEYFDGRRKTFDLDLDHALSSGFRRTVQQWLPHIGYGSTASYSEVAQQVDSPRAVRAVGTACATNPLPVVVPCHRVLRADGGLGGYIGGLEAKRALLDLEARAQE